MLNWRIQWVSHCSSVENMWQRWWCAMASASVPGIKLASSFNAICISNGFRKEQKKSLPKTNTKSISMCDERTNGWQKIGERRKSKVKEFIWFTTICTTIGFQMCIAGSVYLLTIYNFWCIFVLSLSLDSRFLEIKIGRIFFFWSIKKDEMRIEWEREREKDTVPESI